MDDRQPERPIRTAVVGVGHLGKNHARILKAMPTADLVGVVDVQEERARAVGEEWDVPWSTAPLEAPFLWKAETAVVVTPTTFHAELAGAYLEQGLDVFVEKPIATTVEQARELCRLASAHDRILQVGHVERFNPALKAVQELGMEPEYVECERLAPFSFRSMDIGVVLDLMIHDLDLLLTLVPGAISDVEAFGGALFTPAEDIVSARLKFESGAVARVTANRVALRAQRRMRMFSPDSYVSLDFGKRYGLIIQKAPGWDLQKLDVERVDAENIQDLWKFVFDGLLKVRELKMDETNPLEDELRSFLQCVSTRSRPLVDGEAGLRALEAAYAVLEAVARHPW